VTQYPKQSILFIQLNVLVRRDVRRVILSMPFELKKSDLADVSLAYSVGDHGRIDGEAGQPFIAVNTLVQTTRNLKPKISLRVT
jgi:hypothetical protein